MHVDGLKHTNKIDASYINANANLPLVDILGKLNQLIQLYNSVAAGNKTNLFF